MRKFQGFVAVAALGALVLALAGGSVLAADTGSWVVTRTASPIVIDGDTWDWLPAPQATVLLSPAFSLVNAGAIESDKESSGQIYLKYDDEAVYVLGIIKDDNVVGDQAGSGIWQNTGVDPFVWAPEGGVLSYALLPCMMGPRASARGFRGSHWLTLPQIHLRGGPVPKRLVKTPLVVEDHVPPDALASVPRVDVLV